MPKSATTATTAIGSSTSRRLANNSSHIPDVDFSMDLPNHVFDILQRASHRSASHKPKASVKASPRRDRDRDPASSNNNTHNNNNNSIKQPHSARLSDTQANKFTPRLPDVPEHGKVSARLPDSARGAIVSADIRFGPIDSLSNSDEEENLVLKHRSEHAYEGLDDPRWMDKEYVAPSVEKAEQQYSKQVFRNGYSPIWSTTLKDLEELGVGISLHFRLIVYFVWYFLAVTIVAIPIYYIAHDGSRTRDTDMDLIRVTKLSFGNVAPQAALPNGTVNVSPPWSFSLSSRELGWVFTGFDGFLILSFLGFFFFLRHKVATIAAAVDASMITADDYAVYATGFPENVTEEEVRQHFDKRYNLYEEDWTYTSALSRCYFGRKAFQRRKLAPSALVSPQNPLLNIYEMDRVTNVSGKQSYAVPAGNSLMLFDEDVYPVIDCSNTGKPDYLDSWIAEVSLVRSNGRAILQYTRQKALMERIRAARAVIKRLNSESAGTRAGDLGKHEKRQKSAAKRLAALEAKLNTVHAQVRETASKKIVGAFIIFQTEESARRCLEDYSGSNNSYSCSGYLCQAPYLRFRGTHRLTVTKAPDPSEVLWENLDLSKSKRCGRTLGVNLLVLLLLLVSLFAIMVLQGQQDSLRAYAPRASTCNTVIPAVLFGVPFTSQGEIAPGYSMPSGVSASIINNGSCPSGQHQLKYAAADGSLPRTAVHDPNPCFNECIDTTATCLSPAIDGTNTTIPMLLFQTCYCANRLYASVRSADVGQLFQDATGSDGGWCSGYYAKYMEYNGYGVAAAFAIIVVNIALRLFFSVSATWEGHASTTQMYFTTAVKMFVAMVVNTAGILLLINAQFPAPVASWQLGNVPLFNGEYPAMIAAWHSSVGAKIVLTMIINAFTPHIPILLHLFHRCAFRRCCTHRSESTQYQLNKKVQPMSFDVPLRAAITLNTVWVCFMYAAGQPILLLIAGLSFLLTYFVDKWTVLRAARRPPVYDQTIATMLVNSMPFLVILHICFTIWTYSDTSILYSPQTIAVEIDGDVKDFSVAGILTRISRENTAPLTIMLLVIACAIVCYFLWRKVLIHPLSWLIFVVSCGTCCTKQGEHGAGAEYFDDFNNASAFTGPYKLPVRKGFMGFGVLGGRELRINRQLGMDPRGRRFYIYKWMAPGRAFGVRHKAEQRLLTWQVIAETGHIPSYNMAAHPRYSAAVEAMNSGKRQYKREVRASRMAANVLSSPFAKSSARASQDGKGQNASTFIDLEAAELDDLCNKLSAGAALQATMDPQDSPTRKSVTSMKSAKRTPTTSSGDSRTLSQAQAEQQGSITTDSNNTISTSPALMARRLGKGLWKPSTSPPASNDDIVVDVELPDNSDDPKQVGSSPSGRKLPRDIVKALPSPEELARSMEFVEQRKKVKSKEKLIDLPEEEIERTMSRVKSTKAFDASRQAPSSIPERMSKRVPDLTQTSVRAAVETPSDAAALRAVRKPPPPPPRREGSSGSPVRSPDAVVGRAKPTKNFASIALSLMEQGSQSAGSSSRATETSSITRSTSAAGSSKKSSSAVRRADDPKSSRRTADSAPEPVVIVGGRDTGRSAQLESSRSRGPSSYFADESADVTSVAVRPTAKAPSFFTFEGVVDSPSSQKHPVPATAYQHAPPAVPSPAAEVDDARDARFGRAARSRLRLEPIEEARPRANTNTSAYTDVGSRASKARARNDTASDSSRRR